jgi:hypothetical protein
MKIQYFSHPIAATAVASTFIIVLTAVVLGATAAVVEHTFLVRTTLFFCLSYPPLLVSLYC